MKKLVLCITTFFLIIQPVYAGPIGRSIELLKITDYELTDATSLIEMKLYSKGTRLAKITLKTTVTNTLKNDIIKRNSEAVLKNQVIYASTEDDKETVNLIITELINQLNTQKELVVKEDGLYLLGSNELYEFYSDSISGVKETENSIYYCEYVKINNCFCVHHKNVETIDSITTENYTCNKPSNKCLIGMDISTVTMGENEFKIITNYLPL